MGIREVAFSLLLLARVTPGGPLLRVPTLCPVRLATGRPCPTCGLTRSWQAASHGRWQEAAAWHPLGPLTVAGAIWLVVDDSAEARLARLGRSTQALLVAGWLLTWLWRFRASGQGRRARISQPEG